MESTKDVNDDDLVYELAAMIGIVLLIIVIIAWGSIPNMSIDAPALY